MSEIEMMLLLRRIWSGFTKVSKIDGFFEIRHELNWIIVLTIYYTTDKCFCYLQKIFQSKELAMLQFFSKTV